MNKILKRGLIAGGIAFAAFRGYKLFRMAKAAPALQKQLREELTTQFGEEPKLGCSVMANIVIDVSVVAKFSAETLEKRDEIEQFIKTFIADNYPILNIKRLKVIVCDKNMSKLDVIKEYYPKIYKRFGKLIEKKLQASQCCTDCDKEEAEEKAETTTHE